MPEISGRQELWGVMAGKDQHSGGLWDDGAALCPDCSGGCMNLCMC